MSPVPCDMTMTPPTEERAAEILPLALGSLMNQLDPQLSLAEADKSSWTQAGDNGLLHSSQA